MKWYVWKSCKHMHRYNELWFCLKFLSNRLQKNSTENHHSLFTLFYWPTNHYFKFTAFTFLRLMQVTNVQRGNIWLHSTAKHRMTLKWFNWVLKFCPKFQVLISSPFWGWWPAGWALSKNSVQQEYFNSNICWMLKITVSYMTTIFNLSNLKM